MSTLSTGEELVGKRFYLRRHYVWKMKVFMQDWKSYAGWDPLTKQPDDESARHNVILSLLVDHSLFVEGVAKVLIRSHTARPNS